jgi:hypothetical protein
MAEQHPYSAIPDLELVDAMAQLAGGISAMQCELLAIAAEFDRRRAWRDDGASDLASWLRMRLGLSHRTARDWARVTDALGELPACRQAFAEGRLSWDQVRPLTQFATPQTDTRHAADAPGASAAALETEARRARRVDRSEAEQQQEGRHLRYWYQGKDGFRLSAQMPVADGAVVAAALERIAGTLPEQEVDGRRQSHDGRMADALLAMSSTQLAADRDADRACVVVHVEAGALEGEDGGRAELEGGHPIHPAIAQRLCCDGRMEVVVEGRDGVPIGVGRAQRTIPAWLWRMLVRRDGGRCRFCGSLQWLEGHHIMWWSRGGGTDLDNLCLVCTRCHKLFHEGGWTIEGDPNGRLIFRRPDGRAQASGPPALRPSAREALLNAVSAQTLDDLADSSDEGDGAHPGDAAAGEEIVFGRRAECETPGERPSRRSRAGTGARGQPKPAKAQASGHVRKRSDWSTRVRSRAPS